MKEKFDVKVEVCEEETDNSLKFLHADTARPLLKNPDRGLRMESYITLGDPLESYPTNSEDPYKKLEGFFEKYELESPTVLQAYVYLSNYRRKKLDTLAFEQMKKYFELCRENKVRILLRFAYGTESVKDAPYSWVAKHLKQIGLWFEAEKDLINDTIYALQAGIVGYWGEGHSYRSFRPWHIGKAFDDLCEITPEHLFVQVRYIDLAKKVSENHQKRLAMHHDYIIGDLKHEWGYVLPETEEDYYLDYFSKTTNDGELPGGAPNTNDNPELEPLNDMPAEKLIPEMARYHLSTLSLEHSYREDEGKNRPYTLERWRDYYMTTQDLKRLKLPYNPNLYKNKDGSRAQVSAFEYLQMHLGYNLVLSNARKTEEGFSFTISNFGMAAPNNFSFLSLKVGEDLFEVADFDKTALQPGKSIRISFYYENKADFDKPVYVKLSSLKNGNVCVRFANDTDFEDGYQKVFY